MSDEIITREQVQKEFAERKAAEEKAEQARCEEAEKQRLKAEWISTGGDEASFEKEYGSLVAEKRRSEVLERDRAATAEATRFYLEAF
jgi:hypothetical protein